MQAAVMLSSGSKEEIQLSEVVFGCRFNEPLVHQIVTAYLAGGRQGTHAQKNRSEVRGGGKKPWKQKGMGRARAGTIRSPLWRSGGVTFAAKTRDYSQKVNKKMYRLAMRSIYSELLRQDRLVIVKPDFLLLETPKTSHFLAKLKAIELGKNVLIVLDEIEKNIHFAVRNVPNINVLDVEAMNPVQLIDHEKIVITVPAIKQIEELLA